MRRFIAKLIPMRRPADRLAFERFMREWRRAVAESRQVKAKGVGR